MMSYRTFYSLFALTGLLLVSGEVQSQIHNASFEAPALNPDSFKQEIAEWSYGALTGVLRVGNPYFTQDVPDGVQIGYLSGTGVAQRLTQSLEAGNYKLGAYFGRRTDGVEGTASLQLWASGSVQDGDVTGGTLLASKTIAATADITPGAFSWFDFQFDVSDTHSLLGEALTVRIERMEGTQVNFDAIQLTLTPSNVPEPGALALLVGGAIGGWTALRCRKRA